MCCTWLAEKKGCKKSPSAHHRTILSGYISATKAYIDNREKLVKQQYVLHVSTQCGELQTINGWDLLASLGYPCKGPQVLRLAFVAAETSLTRGQPNCTMCGRPDKHPTGCQLGLTTGWTNRHCSFNRVVQPDWQQVVSCKRSFSLLLFHSWLVEPACFMNPSNLRHAHLLKRLPETTMKCIKLATD